MAIIFGSGHFDMEFTPLQSFHDPYHSCDIKSHGSAANLECDLILREYARAKRLDAN